MFRTIARNTVRPGQPLQFHINLDEFPIGGLGQHLREIGRSNGGQSLIVECGLPMTNQARRSSGPVSIITVLCERCGTVSSHFARNVVICSQCGERMGRHPERMRGSPGRVRRIGTDGPPRMLDDRMFERGWDTVGSMSSSKSKEEKEKEEMKHKFEENFDKQWEELSEFNNLPDEIKKTIRDNSLLLHCRVTEDILRGAGPKEYDEIQQREVAKKIRNILSNKLALKMEQDYNPNQHEFKYSTEYVILLPRQIIKLLIKTFWAGFDYNENQNNEEDG